MRRRNVKANGQDDEGVAYKAGAKMVEAELRLSG